MGMGRENLPTDCTAFLDHLADELKIGRDSAYRQAVRHALALVKKNFESGQYQSTTEAELMFRRMVEKEDRAGRIERTQP